MENREERFSVLVYPECFGTKEDAVADTGKIKKRIMGFKESLTLEEIAQKSISGFVMSFIEADTDKGTLSSKHWKSQQIFALDCDNTFPDGKKLTAPFYMDYGEAVSFLLSKGVKPALIYTTGSSTKEHNRYRIVFVMDEKVTDKGERERVTEGLFNLFSREGKSLADLRCRDAGRIFYPGGRIVYSDFKARVDKDRILSLAEIKRVQAEPAPPKSIPEPSGRKDSTAIALIRKELEIIKKGSSLQKKAVETFDLMDFLDDDFRVSVYNLIYSFSFNSINNNILSSKQPAQKSVPANPLRVRNPEDFIAICRKLDLGKLLGLPKEGNFSCIFHEDRKPSAHIVRFNGSYFYKCFSCGHCLNIFGLFEKLFGADFSLTLKWISRKFNIVYETERQREEKKEISLYRDFMLGDGPEKLFPVLYKYLERCRLIPIFGAVSDIARMYVLDGEGETVPNLFYMAQNVLVRVMNRRYGLKKSRASLQKGIIKLAHLGLIRILGDEELPKEIRQRLYALKKEKHRFRISVYSIPRFSMELMEKAEKTVIKDREKGIRSGTLCREGLLRSSGRKEAGKVFVQSGERKQNPKAEEFYKRFRQAAESLISEKGWTTEQIILNRMKWPSRTEKNKLSEVCLPQLLDELNLRRTAFSKALEEKYCIRTRRKMVYGISRIIVSK